MERSKSERTLSRRDAAHSSIWRDRKPEGSRERLELRFGDVVGIAPAEHHDVHSDCGVERDRFEDVANE